VEVPASDAQHYRVTGTRSSLPAIATIGITLLAL
jgi:hypothetical protein